MGNSKKPASPGANSWVRVLLRPQNRGLIFSLLVVLAAVAAALAAWQRFGAIATNSAEFVLRPEGIAVTPQPAWIHSDVKAEVVMKGAVQQMDLRDPQLVERLARAFALHPWVRKVERVEKRFPAQAIVQLSYRQPVAAVEWTDSGDRGLLFVDGEGVLLPSADFASNQAKNFLRISGADKTPAGVGLAWDSELVTGAAKIAAIWGDRWQPLQLYRVTATVSPGGEWVYELSTAGDVRIIWGAAPGKESMGEPSPEQKISTLVEMVRDKGPLDRPGAPKLLDLRRPGIGGAESGAAAGQAR